MFKDRGHINSLFLLLCSCFCFAQQNKIDSIKNQLKIQTADTSQVKLLDALSERYMQSGNLDTALYYAGQSVKKSLEFANNNAFASKKLLGNTYNHIGYIYEYKGEYTNAIANYSKALKLKESLKDEIGIASTLTYMGLVYSQIDIVKALTHYFKAMTIYESLCNSADEKKRRKSKNGIAALYNNIGIIYLDQNELNKALECYTKALAINTEIHNPEWAAKNYANIGIIYMNMRDFNKARDYTLKSLKITKELGLEASIGHTLHALGDIYVYKKEYPLALDYFLKALDIFKKQSFKRGVASCYSNIGSVYLDQKNYIAAEEALTKGYVLSKEIGGWEGLRDVHGYLSDLYAATRKPKLALEHYKDYVVAKDSLVNEANTKKTVQQQMQYEFDKKEAATKLETEKKDAIASAESKKQKIIIYAVSSGLFLILILAIVILRSLRINQKKNEIINLQKQTVEKQKEILDSIYYARRIQMALLPSEKYIARQLTDKNSN
jgi:tetratricopeptide (TPR) repeat protein